MQQIEKIKANFMNIGFRLYLTNQDNFKNLNKYLTNLTKQKITIIDYLIPLKIIASNDKNTYFKAIINGKEGYLILRFVYEEEIANDQDDLFFIDKYKVNIKEKPISYLKILYSQEDFENFLNNYIKVTIYAEDELQEILELYKKGMTPGAIALLLHTKESVIKKLIEYNLKKEGE